MVEPAVVALLEGAAPIVPPTLEPDEEVMVAVWRRGSAAAILSIFHDAEDEEERFSQDIERYEKVDGTWTPSGPGGSDWPLRFGGRPPSGNPFLTGYSSGGAVDGGYVWVASGVAPQGIDSVTVVVAGQEQVIDVEPVSGAFLVAAAHLDDIAIVSR